MTLKELKNEIAISDIIAEVEKDFKNDGILERDIKIYLCRKYTTSKLRDIGIPFGIGESGVSQVCRRFSKGTQADTSLKRRLKKIEQRLSKMKT